MKFCHETTKDVARNHNDEAIEKSVEYNNYMFKPITFEEGELVLLKAHNFLDRNKKLVENFKDPFKVVKVNENGTVKIKTKYAKHDQFVHQNLLVPPPQEHKPSTF